MSYAVVVQRQSDTSGKCPADVWHVLAAQGRNAVWHQGTYSISRDYQVQSNGIVENRT